MPEPEIAHRIGAKPAGGQIVEDAARGLDEERVEAVTKVWRERGVEFANADDVVRTFA